MRKYMNQVLVGVVCVLVGLLIAKEHKINELQLENKELANKIVLNYIEEEEANRTVYVRDGIYLVPAEDVCTNRDVHYHEEDYFWCDNCKESYNHYCEGCGQGKELWDKYYNEYVMMNYCEYCDTCYYKYCDCEGATEYIGQDFVEFTIEYDEYLHDYCTNYCNDCDEYYYDHCCGCENCDDSERYYDDYRAYLDYKYNK